MECTVVGTDITNAEEVAIKLECVKTKHPQLQIEGKIYRMMQGGGNWCACWILITQCTTCEQSICYGNSVHPVVHPSVSVTIVHCAPVAEHIMKTLVNTISHKPMKGISPSFGHRCISVRSADWVLNQRLKVKVTAGSDLKNGVNTTSW